MSRSRKVRPVLMVCLLVAGSLFAQELAQIALPAPQTRGGKPVMEALALRVTSRAFATTPLPLQIMANLLWAAQGMNGPKGADAMSGATPIAPSAVGWQEIDVYVVMKAGAYLYDWKTNVLKPVVSGDLRALTGIQPFVQDAPATLVYVADSRRIGYPPGFPQALMEGAERDKEYMVWADAALISQNVSLFCASGGLATGLREAIDRPPLAEALKLDSAQTVIMAQCVGYPKK
jgi:nitroreductase